MEECALGGSGCKVGRTVDLPPLPSAPCRMKLPDFPNPASLVNPRGLANESFKMSSAKSNPLVSCPYERHSAALYISYHQNLLPLGCWGGLLIGSSRIVVGWCLPQRLMFMSWKPKMRRLLPAHCTTISLCLACMSLRIHRLMPRVTLSLWYSNHFSWLPDLGEWSCTGAKGFCAWALHTNCMQVGELPIRGITGCVL